MHTQLVGGSCYASIALSLLKLLNVWATSLQTCHARKPTLDGERAVQEPQSAHAVRTSRVYVAVSLPFSA